MTCVWDQEFELTLTDLAERFGPMPASRIRRSPRPGTATIDDLLAIHHEDEGKLCELVDGKGFHGTRDIYVAVEESETDRRNGSSGV